MRAHLLRRSLPARRAVLLLYVVIFSLKVCRLERELADPATVRVKEAATRPDGVFYAALRHLFALENAA